MLKLYPIFFIVLLTSSLLFFFSPVSVQAKEAWEDQGLEWYYDNLTDEDRQKIRQAMDYAIPREKIIDEIMRGYALPLATDIASNMIGHDSSIQAREFNITKSKELLAEVFGKWYELKSVADATIDTSITNTPYFKVTLIVPSTCTTLIDWQVLIVPEFKKIGIEAALKFFNWNIIMPRIFVSSAGEGYNYDHGGYDTLLHGISISSDPDYSSMYYPESFPPVGDNFIWIDRPDFTEIINRSLMSTNEEDRLQALKESQLWFYEWVPRSITHQKLDLFPQTAHLQGFDPYNYGREPWVHNLSLIENNFPYNFTSCVYTDFTSFNPILSTSWVDSVVTSNIHLSLTGRRGAYNITHPIGQVAESWNSSSNRLEWFVSLRQGLLFHDSSEVTADDVVFSYKAAMECPDSVWKDKMLTWFNNSDDISKVDNYTVKFHLKKFNPYATSQVFGLPILSKAQLEPIGYANWKTDGTNTGFTPLIGCGPYEFTEYNYPNVTCKKASTWNTTLMGHDPTSTGGGIWWDIVGPEIYSAVVVKEVKSTVTDLEKGIYNLLDLNIPFFDQIEELEADNMVKIVTYPRFGWYELAYNHYDPRWGLNPHDPREMYPEDLNNDAPFEILLVMIALLGFTVICLVNGKKRPKNGQ